MEKNTNTSLSSSVAEFPLHFRILKLSLYVIIFVTSLVANVLVCTVILRRRKMKTVTNYFILNLAVADMSLTCICIPFDIPVQELHYSWPYGSLMCKILYPMQTFLLLASVYTLTAVSLTRQRAIVYPMKKQLTKTGAKIIILVVWLFAIIPVTPYFHALKFNPVMKTCQESWDNTTTTKVYTTSIFVFQYVLPFCIMFLAYFSISRELRQRAKNGNRCLKDLQEEEARKVTRMLKVVTTLFALCLLPNNIMWLWLDYGNADKHCKHFWELVAFSNILILANSAANPICYTVFNENYRQEMKRLLTQGPCRRHDSASKKDERITPPKHLLKDVKNRTSTMISSV
ncbi:neuropeptide FF receptor 2-like [Oculina patagonica]